MRLTLFCALFFPWAIAAAWIDTRFGLLAFVKFVLATVVVQLFVIRYALKEEQQ